MAQKMDRREKEVTADTAGSCNVRHTHFPPGSINRLITHTHTSVQLHTSTTGHISNHIYASHHSDKEKHRSEYTDPTDMHRVRRAVSLSVHSFEVSTSF